jgi:capsular exopolysaccharide synthesis family protein
MSHIFDALQRSETERSGVELDALGLPTDLLQRAESSAKGRVATSAGNVAVLDAPTGAPLSELEGIDGGLTASPSSIPQFETLPVTLQPNSKLVSSTAKDGLAAEKFRFLAVRLRHLAQRRQLKQLLITSTMPEEGKSTVAANLACTLATRRQHKVLLVEGDLRRPTLHREFGLHKIAGVTEYLQGVVDTTLPIYRLDSLGIWFMPAGKTPENPLELMQSGKLSVFMERIKSWFDWVVIDSPPILPLADTSVWTRMVDGILLVTRQGTTDKEQLKRGLEAIDSSKLLGALLNSSANAATVDYYQRYGQPPAAAEGSDQE